MNEIEHAQALLKIKNKGYPNPKVVLFGKTKLHILRWLILGVFLLFVINSGEDIGMNRFTSIGLGFLIGSFVKEFLFMKKIGELWPYTDRITNWKLVKEIAESESSVGD